MINARKNNWIVDNWTCYYYSKVDQTVATLDPYPSRLWRGLYNFSSQTRKETCLDCSNLDTNRSDEVINGGFLEWGEPQHGWGVPKGCKIHTPQKDFNGCFTLFYTIKTPSSPTCLPFWHRMILSKHSKNGTYR